MLDVKRNAFIEKPNCVGCEKKGFPSENLLLNVERTLFSEETSCVGCEKKRFH